MERVIFNLKIFSPINEIISMLLKKKEIQENEMKRKEILN